MTLISIPVAKTTQGSLIWLVGVSFVLFQFFLQLSSGVIIGAIMYDMQLSAWQAGLLSSSFYYVYTSMQIPVGMLFDRKNTRLLLTLNAVLCTIGCVFFAQSTSLLCLIIGRLLIGAGSAFAFVGLSHLLRQHFPLKQFAFMIGLSETLGFLVTMFGLIGLGALISEWGWRSFINSAALLGLIISCLCWLYIPVASQETFSLPKYSKQLLGILSNGKAWINGLFVGLSFTVITVFGAMWAVPFIQVKLACSLKQASFIDAMIFLGAGLSCPLFGKLASLFKRRKPLMVSSCLSTALLIGAVLYLPFDNAVALGWLMFLIGLCCGAYMLAFSIANELAPADSLSTCAGFTNTLAMLSAPLMQPLVGYILDTVNHTSKTYTLANYQTALLIIPVSLVLSSCLVLFLPEKTTNY
ncbi:MFS transporter [Legionella feeleii]|uniref:Major facilitator family transporter n=1 Tax=Legionella feeleii TaxID=453 RepID=A0A0W0U3U1_9GAMM|nr:MFS transporter [Legionella feeleii]KTD02592.1 major facilitator family transporter [Legionella feeleii]SPX62138.1 major facilitator family transporter [Legionella feeleii]